MRIAINLLFLRPGMVGGSEVFTRNLIENLLISDKTNQYIFLVPKNIKKQFHFDKKNAECLELNLNNNSVLKRVMFEQFYLPKKIKKEKFDLLINLGNTGILFSSAKQLLVVHDLIYFIYPQYFSILKRFYLQKMVGFSCKKAWKIVTISQSTKKDIINFLKISPKKISVIYCGIDFDKFSKIKKEDGAIFVLKKYGIKDYLYSPTSTYPHKNNETLIKAFAKIKKDKNISQKLIITGVDPYKKKKELEELIFNSGMQGEIFYLGTVPFDHLPFIYAGSDAMLYLSKYEGFGLPILEAMSAKTPVISSNRSSMPEVIGNAGILVNPENIDEITEKLYKLLTDGELRSDIIEKGTTQLKKFSWEKTANKMIKEYESIYNNTII